MSDNVEAIDSGQHFGSSLLAYIFATDGGPVFRRSRAVVLALVGFMVGFGAGAVIEQWRMWRDQQGYFNEVLRQLAILQVGCVI